MNARAGHVQKKDVAVLVLCASFLFFAVGAVGQAGRQRAREFTCRSNVKQLSGAWLKYEKDHDGELVGGSTSPGNWVELGQYSNTTEQKLGAIRRGLLFPYVGDVRIYRCPAQEKQEHPKQFGLRSFAIAGGANGESWSSYERATKYSDLENPAMRYIFVEEPDPRGGLGGSWQMHPRKVGPMWVDPIGMWHDTKSSLGFADGHAETHAWHDRSFIEWNRRAMYSPATFNFAMTPPADEQDDINYMAKGFPYKSLK
jgi:prepilin-type processing-associated H-X9-DG protein